jgi:ribosomal-protein-alanine N-acetyltransferase
MLRTGRLILRQWKPDDLAPFAELNADAEVMEFFPKRLSRDESDDLADRLAARIEERGWGLWATELLATGEFVGFVGLSVPRWQSFFTPCVEIGWRLARRHWGQGYAPEAARAALAYAFGALALEEVVSFTTPQNQNSIRVMQKLGMTLAGEFDHPELADDHALRRHVLYRVRREAFAAAQLPRPQH